ncbi:MAG: hypothetical protein ACFFEF_03030 [Candidatus Thorarchaeota archaeon]
MAASKKLLSQVQKIVDALDEGKLDPLDIHLLEAYRELRDIAAEVGPKLDIDEMLNEILGAKITKIQELAKVLAAPELYVNKLKEIKPRELGKLIVYKQPMILNSLKHEELTSAFERIAQHIDALTREAIEDPVPVITGVPDDYRFATQDSVFLADLEKFSKQIPKNKRVLIQKLIDSEDFDEFLMKFLYVVVLISRGELEYFPETREVLKTR